MSYFVFDTVHNKILNKTIFKNGDMNISSYFPHESLPRGAKLK